MQEQTIRSSAVHYLEWGGTKGPQPLSKKTDVIPKRESSPRRFVKNKHFRCVIVVGSV